MEKSVFTFLFGILLLFGITSAHDCHLFPELSVKNLEKTLFESSVKGNPALATLTEEGLRRALINLKAHCCASQILGDNAQMLASCKKDAKYLAERTNYPQSSFLFDHIIDVMMRRLMVDGKYEELPLDKKAQEWREKTDRIADGADGVIPVAISKDYKKFWGLQPEFLIPEYNGVSAPEYKKAINDLESKKAIFAKYEDWNLNTRYYNLCQSAIYLMTHLPIDFWSEQMALAQKKCSSMTQQNIVNEITNLSRLISHKSELLLAQNMENYADAYLMDTRWGKFEEKSQRMLSNLFGVMRMVPKLISMCN